MAILVVWWKNLSLRYIFRIVGPQSVDQSTVSWELLRDGRRKKRCLGCGQCYEVFLSRFPKSKLLIKKRLGILHFHTTVFTNWLNVVVNWICLPTIGSLVASLYLSSLSVTIRNNIYFWRKIFKTSNPFLFVKLLLRIPHRFRLSFAQTFAKDRHLLALFCLVQLWWHIFSKGLLLISNWNFSFLTLEPIAEESESHSSFQ